MNQTTNQLSYDNISEKTGHDGPPEPIENQEQRHGFKVLITIHLEFKMAFSDIYQRVI